MRLRIHSYHGSLIAHVTLSRSNLLSLLHNLELEGSARTLSGGNALEPWELIVTAQDDREHYREAGRPPRPMHPYTEAFLREEEMRHREEQPGSASEAGTPAVADLASDQPTIAHPVLPETLRQAVVTQDKYWWDRFGRRFRIDQMPLPYLMNVMSYLERRSPWIFSSQTGVEEEGEALTETAAGVPSCAAAADFDDCFEWLRQTPLMLALARAAEAHFGQNNQ